MMTDGQTKNSPSECVFGENRVKVVRGCYLLFKSLSMTFTAKLTSDFLFFSCNTQINHTTIENVTLPLITANTNIFTLLSVQTPEEKRENFHFGRLPFDVTSSLISLLPCESWGSVKSNFLTQFNQTIKFLK